MKEISGLDNLREAGSSKVICGICHNYLEVVSNGWFHGQLFYCPKDKKVFAIYLRDITTKAEKEFIQQCEKDIKLKEIRFEVTKENMDKVKEAIEDCKRS